MTFHLSPEFMNAVEATAKYHKLQEVFIEKDYWITYALKNISLSDYQNQVVFKGGTSLSKAYRCIERFSEDIDLALLKSDKDSNLNIIIVMVSQIAFWAVFLLSFSKNRNILRGTCRRVGDKWRM